MRNLSAQHSRAASESFWFWRAAAAIAVVLLFGAYGEVVLVSASPLSLLKDLIVGRSAPRAAMEEENTPATQRLQPASAQASRGQRDWLLLLQHTADPTALYSSAAMQNVLNVRDHDGERLLETYTTRAGRSVCWSAFLSQLNTTCVPPYDYALRRQTAMMMVVCQTHDEQQPLDLSCDLFTDAFSCTRLITDVQFSTYSKFRLKVNRLCDHLNYRAAVERNLEVLATSHRSLKYAAHATQAISANFNGLQRENGKMLRMQDEALQAARSGLSSVEEVRAELLSVAAAQANTRARLQNVSETMSNSLQDLVTLTADANETITGEHARLSRLTALQQDAYSKFSAPLLKRIHDAETNVAKWKPSWSVLMYVLLVVAIVCVTHFPRTSAGRTPAVCLAFVSMLLQPTLLRCVHSFPTMDAVRVPEELYMCVVAVACCAVIIRAKRRSESVWLRTQDLFRDDLQDILTECDLPGVFQYTTMWSGSGVGGTFHRGYESAISEATSHHEGRIVAPSGPETQRDASAKRGRKRR